MSKFCITVKEETSVTYTVESKTPEEAEKLFAIWMERNSGVVSHDMERNFCGYDIGNATPCLEESDLPDIWWEDFMIAVSDSLCADIEHALNRMKLVPTDALLRDLSVRIMDDVDFPHTCHWTDSDIENAIASYLNELIQRK